MNKDRFMDSSGFTVETDSEKVQAARDTANQVLDRLQPLPRRTSKEEDPRPHS